MKKYTNLTFVETAQAMQDNKCVEWYRAGEGLWGNSDNTSVYRSVKYRLVEEVEEWKAGVGETVRVRLKGALKFEPDPREYRGTIDGIHYCKEDNGGNLWPWDEIAPAEKEKREPRVHWCNEHKGKMREVTWKTRDAAR